VLVRRAAGRRGLCFVIIIVFLSIKNNTGFVRFQKKHCIFCLKFQNPYHRGCTLHFGRLWQAAAAAADGSHFTVRRPFSSLCPHKPPEAAIYMQQTQIGSCCGMKGNPEERAVQLGEYITETGATVRSAAKAFGISKSTVHKDITYRLEKQNHTLYDEVQKVLRVNKEERHLRGGAATRQKYHPEIE